MISQHVHTATLAVDDGYPLPLKAGTVKLDEGWSPYAQGTLTLGIPDEDLQEMMDPRANRRVTIVCSATYTGAASQSRTFDLLLRDRTIDHGAAEMTVTLASDEALTQDDVFLGTTANLDAVAYQSSLRDIINNVVLARVGATLEPGDADTTFYVVSDSTNLCTNPSFATNTTDWNAYGGSGGVTSLTRPTSNGKEGAAYLSCLFTTGTTARGGGVYYEQPASAYTPGQKYLFRAWVSTTHVGQKIRINSEWKNASGTLISTSMGAPVIFPVSDAWYLVTLVAEAPPLAVRGAMTIYADPTGANWASGNYLNVDGARISPASKDYTDTGYFDGSTTATDEYIYAWAGTAGNSTATRKALLDRSPDLLDWEPGESSWSFVQPLFQAAAFRLYCDEQRKWWLVDTTYIAPGFTQLSTTYNLSAAQDQISRGGDDWFDAALIVYRWTDSTDGTPQVAYDWFASPDHTQVKTFEVNRAYPGPGWAEYKVHRAEGKGRTLSLSAVSLYSAQPTQPVAVTLPGTPIQTGVVGSVTFDLGTDEMQISTRGLTDTPTTAYVFGPPGVSYLDVPTGISYDDFDWSDL